MSTFEELRRTTDSRPASNSAEVPAFVWRRVIAACAASERVQVLWNEGRSLARRRTAPILALAALVATGAYAVSSAPSSLSIVNGYYGDSNGTTPLSALISSGATSKLTHLTYAFAQANAYDPCQGIPTAMNATDVANLRKQNPQIKILISLGGASTDTLFDNAIAHYGSATAFAQACVPELMNAPFGSGTVGQYVNGIDIDWEAPQNSTDETNYSNVMQAFRTELNTYASSNGLSRFLLTAAVGPEYTTVGWQFISFPDIIGYVDFFNVEFYQYASGYGGITYSDAPISEIDQDLYGGSDYGAQGLITYGGLPANQIVLLIPFYGDHYTNVSDGTTIGTSGTYDSSQTTGVPPYSTLIAMFAANPSAYKNYSDMDGSAWTWNSSTGDWWEYDNPNTIGQKISYAGTKGLLGAGAWNLEHDTTSGTLLNGFVLTTNVTSSMSITSTGLIYNRFTKQGTETVTVKNISGTTISGPVNFVLASLAGATAANNTGTYNGNPYWTVTAGSMTPGASVKITLTFNYAAGATVSATPSVYSGNF